MGSLTATLLGAANAMDAFQYALNVSQNNIENASTPGYARQLAMLQALPFNPSTGLSGGVAQGQMLDTRDLFAERDVWEQAASQGDAGARYPALMALQNALPVSADGSIPAALNTFFNDVSAWSTSPGDSGVRQAVIDAAGTLVQSFQTAAAGVAVVSQSTDQSIRDTVNQINQLTGQISALNAGVANGGHQDEGLQAQIYSKLESLSGLVNITVLPQPGGTVNVMIAGGAALVVGSQSYALSADSGQAVTSQPVDSQAPPHALIRASDGSDATSQITSGSLAGLLQVRNVIVPSLLGDATQAGALNQMAQTLAQRVNTILGQGSISPGVPSTGGLFITDPAHPCSAAASLALDPAMTASKLPAIDANGAPNGIPLQLAALANPQQPADEIDSISYTQFYGNTAAQVGREVNLAQSDQDLSTQLLAQARTTRQTASGVSLNQEAINILQFQQAYQAAAKLVTTLDNLTQSVINMIP